MGVSGALRRGRQMAESLMLDSCIVRRLTGTTIDPDTAAEVETWEQIYPDPATPTAGGRCKIAGDRPYEEAVNGGGLAGSRQRYILHLPWSAGPLAEGDVAEVVSSVFQPHAVGNRYRIAGPDERSLQTAQRVFIDTM